VIEHIKFWIAQKLVDCGSTVATIILLLLVIWGIDRISRPRKKV